MNRFLPAILLAVTASSVPFAANASAGVPQLHPFTNPTARFEAMMPTGVTSKTTEGKTLVDTVYRSTAEFEGGKMEVRVQVLIPIKLDDQAMLDQYGESMVNQAEKQFTKSFGEPSKTRGIIQNGSKGKEFTFRLPGHLLRSGKDLVIRRRVLFDGQRLYQLIAEGTPAVVDSDETSNFLDSVGPLQ